MNKTLIYGIIALMIVIIAAGVVFFLNDPNGENGADEGDRGEFFDTLFPFNFGGGTDEDPLFEDGDQNGDAFIPEIPSLRQISADPVSGAYIFERDGVTVVRFIDRATGHLFETEAENATVVRLTNTTIPGIQEVFWENENEFIVRYLGETGIESFFVSLDPEAEGEQSLAGRFMESFNRAALDSETGALFSVFETDTGSQMRLSETNGGGARVIFESPISSWVPLQSENELYVYTAPASGIDGFLYQITGDSLTRIVGDIPGFTARVNKGGTAIALGSGSENVMTLDVLNTTTGGISLIPLNTLPEKCVFISDRGNTMYCAAPFTLPSGNYPNDWLLGRVSFSDDIWFVEPETGIAEFIASGESVDESFDVWQPMIAPSGTHLIFINKNDLSLWSLRLIDVIEQAN